MRPGHSRAQLRLPPVQRGAALVVAMLLAAIATGIVASLLWHQQLWLRQYDFEHDRIKAQSLARSGIDWARLILLEDARRNTIDHFGEQWAIRLPATPLETGEIGGAIIDQQGLFNVNALVRDGVVQPDILARYRRLLQMLDLPLELAAALGDWVDAKSVPSPSGGAEDAYYSALDPPRLSSNRPLATIEELALVAGYTPERIKRLQPFVTALPEAAGSAVNVNTAPPEVLAASIEGLSLADANRLVAGRLARPFLNLADFRARLPGSGITLNEQALRVSSDAFVIRVDVRQGEVRSTGTAMVLREAGKWPRLVWQMIE